MSLDEAEMFSQLGNKTKEIREVRELWKRKEKKNQKYTEKMKKRPREETACALQIKGLYIRHHSTV